MNNTADLSENEDYHGLTGFKLSLFRFARFIGLLRVYRSYQCMRHGWSMLPRFDPFDSTHLLFALSDRIRGEPRDHIEITESSFASWLDPKVTRLRGFEAGKYFLRLTRELGTEPNPRAMITCGIAGALFIASSVRNRLLIIDVVHRFDRLPKLTRGQFHHLSEAARSSPVINAEVIARLRDEALSADWPFPYEHLIPSGGQPLQICFQRRPLLARLFRK